MSLARQMRRARMRGRGPRDPGQGRLLDCFGWEPIRDGVDYDQYRIDERGAFGRMDPSRPTGEQRGAEQTTTGEGSWAQTDG